MADEVTSIAAPQYDSATQAALNGNLENDLDNDQIIADHRATTDQNEDVYARQALIRAQAETAAAAQKLTALEQQQVQMATDNAYLRGQVETLATNSTAAQRQAEAQQAAAAAEAQFQLTPDEQAAHGEAVPAIQKIVGRALHEQRQQIDAMIDQRLSQGTQAAVAPLQEQLRETQTQVQLNQQNTQRTFDQQVNNAFAARQTNLTTFVALPEFKAEANKQIPGLGKTHYEQFRENANAGNLDGMMEFVDHVMAQRPFDTTANASVPGGGAPRIQTSEEAQAVAARQQIETQLQVMEDHNSVGNYGPYGGSRKTFMEKRNELLAKLSQTTLT